MQHKRCFSMDPGLRRDDNYLIALLKCFVIAFLFASPVATQAQEETAKETSKTSARAQTLSDLENYLNNLTTILAEFTQVAPDGNLSSGKFYLERPGKMRWQYNPPTPVLMVTSGSSLTFYDYQLEQLSYVPLDDTLAGFLTKKIISFSDGAIKVDSVERANGAIRVSLHQASRPKDGSLTLEFTDRPIILKNMVIIDVSGQITSVSLNNARFGVPLDPQLFVFKDPREGPRVKR